jgi:hypothetical protein
MHVLLLNLYELCLPHRGILIPIKAAPRTGTRGSGGKRHSHRKLLRHLHPKFRAAGSRRCQPHSRRSQGRGTAHSHTEGRDQEVRTLGGRVPLTRWYTNLGVLSAPKCAQGYTRAWSGRGCKSHLCGAWRAAFDLRWCIATHTRERPAMGAAEGKAGKSSAFVRLNSAACTGKGLARHLPIPPYR